MYCQSSLEDDRCTRELSFGNQNISAFYFNGSCFLSTDSVMREQQAAAFNILAPVSPAEEFFENYILEKSPTLDLAGFGGGLNFKVSNLKVQINHG
jgi:hypothetical protein